MSIPICIDINDDEVEISKNLDRNSIVNNISKYNQDLASEICIIKICEIQFPKTKNTFKIDIAPYSNHKFRKYYK